MIRSFCTDAAGDVYAAIFFTNDPNDRNYYVARWNSMTWSKLGNDSFYSSVGYGDNGPLICTCGINNIFNKEKPLMIYPTPTSDKITVETSQIPSKGQCVRFFHIHSPIRVYVVVALMPVQGFEEVRSKVRPSVARMMLPPGLKATPSMTLLVECHQSSLQL
jgi:hypothetical protein